MSGNDRRRPVAQAASESNNVVAASSPFYAAVRASCEAHAVVVVTEEPDGEQRYARRLYLSLHSAQKALKRAEKRGRRAELVLCRLTPLPESDDSASTDEAGPTYFRLPIGGEDDHRR